MTSTGTLTGQLFTRQERFVLAAIRSLKPDHEWAGLTQLRPLLYARGMSRQAQDAALKSLSAGRWVAIVPEDNCKALRAEDHEAALWLGGDANHLVAVDTH